MNARTTQADRRRGPSRIALAALALSAFALLATSPATPSLRGRATGEVSLSGGESVERDLRVHIDPRGGGGDRGSIDLFFQAASGLQNGSSDDVTIALVGASDAAGPFAPDATFPVARCTSGCDLTYRIRISAGAGILPGSIVRYGVDVLIYYPGYGPDRDGGLLRLDLDGAAPAPAIALLSILAGLLALVVGMRTGPRLDRALVGSRRIWPARALMAFAVVLAGWVVLAGVVNVLRPSPYGSIPWSPELVLAIGDPWTIGLMGTLTWGIWRGLRRWPTDGGWSLGLAAVATVGLGGLFLAWWSTLQAVIQPIALALPFVLLGSVGGVVIGQAWRTDPAVRHDRWWAALAVLGHGVVLAGFGFLAESSLYDPFGGAPSSLLALIPLVLIGLAFHRWLGGGRRWLVLFDLIVATIGLVGWRSMDTFTIVRSPSDGPLEIGYVAVMLAVVASIVALVTAFHGMPKPEGPDEAESPAAGQPIGGSALSPAVSSDGAPPTT